MTEVSVVINGVRLIQGSLCVQLHAWLFWYVDLLIAIFL